LKKKLLTSLKVLIFLALGLFLVWFALRDVDSVKREQIKTAFGNARYSWVILSLALGILSHISRAMRWKLMLETLGHKPRLSNTFFAVMIGYMANYAVPRLGEASRCGVLTRYEKIPFTESFGTVIAERLVDVLSLLIVFVITFLIQFEQINLLAHQYVIDPLALKFVFISTHPLLSILGLLVLISGFIFFLRLRNKEGNGILNKLIRFVSGFWEGIKTVKNLKRPWAFIGHSVFIWLMYYAALHLCFFALRETAGLSIGEGLSIFALGTLGVIFTPGGIGAYHVIVATVLYPFLRDHYHYPDDLSKSISIAFPWIVWTSQFILILAGGLISLILLPVLNKEVNGTETQNQS
jgi:uncharacterized protein (TIRG00374 family)